MTVLDIIIAAVVLWGLYRGFQAGAIKTALTLIGWLVALVAGTRLADTVAPMFADFVDNTVLQTALGFLAVCLVVISIVHLIIYLFKSSLKALRLDFLDKLAGGVLGATKGVLKVLVVLSFTAPLLTHLPMWQSSALTQSLMPFAPMARQLITNATGEAWQYINQ